MSLWQCPLPMGCAIWSGLYVAPGVSPHAGDDAVAQHPYGSCLAPTPVAPVRYPYCAAQCSASYRPHRGAHAIGQLTVNSDILPPEDTIAVRVTCYMQHPCRWLPEDAPLIRSYDVAAQPNPAG